jgi:hypothetical protein
MAQDGVPPVVFAVVGESDDEYGDPTAEYVGIYSTLAQALSALFAAREGSYESSDRDFNVQEVTLNAPFSNELHPRVIYDVVEGKVIRYTRMRFDTGCVVFEGTLAQFRAHKYLLRKTDYSTDDMFVHFEFDHGFTHNAPALDFDSNKPIQGPEYHTAEETRDPSYVPVVQACVLSNEPTLKYPYIRSAGDKWTL